MKSFVYSRGSDKVPACSVFSYVKGRREPRRNSLTWADQTIPVEVIVAEFGPCPDVFADYETLEHIDKYIFCYQPADAPFSVCWWRNVAAFQCSCSHALQIDCDIAMSRNAAETMLGLANDNPSSFIHPRRISVSTVPPKEDAYESIKLEFEKTNCEAVWMYDLLTYKTRGGWPESYAGMDSEILQFRKIMAGVNTVHVDVAPLFCHVPHAFTKNRVGRTRGLIPLAPWLPTHTTWPLEAWVPGRIDLYEREP